LTLDGLYLNDQGNFLVGRALAQALRPKADFSKVYPASPWFKQLRDTVRRKTYHVAESFRPSNGVHYYSVRARSYEYEAEVPHHMNLANQLDRRTWQLADLPGKTLGPIKLPTQKAKPPSKGGRRGTGVIKSVKEDLEAFEVADGYTVDCFASNETFPDLVNPMQVHAGRKGRIWAATFGTYPIPVPGAPANDKILIFEDTNGDGKADKRTVFADNLLLPDGFVFYRDGVIVSVPRKLLWLRDTDGDDRADQTVELLAGIDDTDTHHGGFLATTPSGRITFCEGVFHRTQVETPWGVVHSKDATALNFDPRTRRVTVERQTKAPNPWKITHNSWGEGYQMFGGGQTIDVDLYTLGLPAGSKPMDSGGLFRHDKGCAMAAVSSPHFPESWQDSVVTGHLLGRNVVIYTPMKQSNGVYKQQGQPIDLLNMAKNKSFRPVDLCFGLDGALYVSDLYYPIIGHAQHSVRDENRDYTHGRIWRVTRKGVPLLKTPKIAGASVDALLDLLTHVQVRVRELARVELGLHPDVVVRKAMKAWLPAADADDAVAQRKRLEALWVFERRGIDDPSVLRQVLASGSSQTRAAGARSLRHWGSVLGKDAFALARKALADEDPRVRMGAISSISFLQWEDPNWHTMLGEHAEPKGSSLASMHGRAKTAPEPLMKPVVPILAAREGTRLKGWAVKGNEGTIWFRAQR
ncbi:MAG: hypothetical protein OER86_14365, partial [Phycisphaerae bacterium]|nr:hypothetical protein [Phycisphaerae bacterium]